jgi:hypothetical protein
VQVKPIKTSDLESELVGDLLWSPAQLIYGSNLDDEELLQAVSEIFPSKQTCVVRNWMIIEIRLTARAKRPFASRGLQPFVLYANTLVGSQSGNEFGLLSGYQRSYEDCFFETDEMFFVLAGRGSRKRADEEAVRALARRCGSDEGLALR